MRVLKKSVLVSWPTKCHFGTNWVYRGEHGSLTHNFKYTFPPFLSKPNPPKFTPGENGNCYLLSGFYPRLHTISLQQFRPSSTSHPTQHMRVARYLGYHLLYSAPSSMLWTYSLTSPFSHRLRACTRIASPLCLPYTRTPSCPRCGQCPTTAHAPKGWNRFWQLIG